MQPDEGTFFEIAGCYHRYHCPLSRTVYLGKPPPHFLDAEKAVLEGMEAGLEKAYAGNTCEDIAMAFFAVLDRHGSRRTAAPAIPSGSAIRPTGASAPSACGPATAPFWSPT